jgi:hypothetical protein
MEEVQMKRVSGVLIIAVILLLAVSPGCKKETTTDETGLNITTANCLTFGIWVFLDGQYQGMISSEEPHFFSLPSGTYELSARSNADLGEIYFCWTQEVTVNDGGTTEVLLDCDGAECTE